MPGSTLLPNNVTWGGISCNGNAGCSATVISENIVNAPACATQCEAMGANAGSYITEGTSFFTDPAAGQCTCYTGARASVVPNNTQYFRIGTLPGEENDTVRRNICTVYTENLVFALDLAGNLLS